MDKFFSIASTPAANTTDIVMGWRWAMEHPILHTIIEVGHSPYLLAVLVIVGGKIVGDLIFRRGRSQA